MKRFDNPPQSEWSTIIARPAIDLRTLQDKVRTILDDVKINGDNAVRKYTKQFDGHDIETFAVSKDEIETAAGLVSPELKKAIKTAAANIRTFHEKQLRTPVTIETMPGVNCWRRSVAIEKVGLYIPGGTAPLFSTVLMLGIPAKIAGCANIILCTPPTYNNSIHPAILFAADLVGINRIFKVGGVQAIGAMAYGTDTIPKSYKLFGPGNQYVNCAKQLVQMDGVSIDMPAGPSEVCVLADESCDPSYVAADLLSQAEHGADSQVLLVCNKPGIFEEVSEQLQLQLQKLPRRETAEQALANSHVVIMNDLDASINLVNAYAPEHLIIACKDAELIGEKIINAGSVFLGNYSPESAGDYASGTNHTLPTNGFATSYSGVSVDSFVKKITYQQISKEGLQMLGPAIEHMAEAEGLVAHKNAVSIRLKK